MSQLKIGEAKMSQIPRLDELLVSFVELDLGLTKFNSGKYLNISFF